jgi:hypothetical protein
MHGLTRSLKRGGNLVKQNITRHTIKVRDLSLTVSATGAAVGFGTVVAGDIPEGNVMFLGAVGYLKFDGSGSDANLTADWEGDFSVGTTGTADVTLDGTDVDILPSTPLAAATAEQGVRTRAVNITGAIFDNTDGSLEINISALIDAADITDDQSVILTVNGEIELIYVVVLDD